jgi:hypothetical protein
MLWSKLIMSGPFVGQQYKTVGQQQQKGWSTN